MKTVSIYGKLKSAGARSLRHALKEITKIKPYFYGPEQTPPTDYVINWGNTLNPAWTPKAWFNPPDCVFTSVNKLTCFQTLKAAGIDVPEFTIDKKEVKEWLNNEHIVLARVLLRASGGRGIEIIRTGEEIKDAGIYVKYIRKDSEYRVHVVGEKVIDFAAKKRQTESEQTPDQKLIRSHANGWVFCRQGVGLPDEAGALAVRSVKALGLDFGAVDMVVSKRGKPFVLEVNTAPGLEGQTIINYANAFAEKLNAV
jgi:glutathione synthase/RimK-type ligase-like ATP-grasp enzyme